MQHFFVDFDDVLFNTRAFMDDLVAACAPHGVTPAMWHETYASRAGDIPDVHAPFTIARFAEQLAARRDVAADAQTLQRAMEDATMADLPRYVFGDSVDFLRACAAAGAVYILTYGDDAFQRARVAGSGLGALVRDVFVTQTQKVHVLEDFLVRHGDVRAEDIVYLDDRVTYFAPVKKSLPQVCTVLVARPERRYDDAPDAATDLIAADLSASVLQRATKCK